MMEPSCELLRVMMGWRVLLSLMRLLSLLMMSTHRQIKFCYGWSAADSSRHWTTAAKHTSKAAKLNIIFIGFQGFYLVNCQWHNGAACIVESPFYSLWTCCGFFALIYIVTLRNMSKNTNSALLGTGNSGVKTFLVRPNWWLTATGNVQNYFPWHKICPWPCLKMCRL